MEIFSMVIDTILFMLFPITDITIFIVSTIILSAVFYNLIIKDWINEHFK